MAQITLTPIIEGTLARASEVMGNFQAIADVVNGGLDGSNIQDSSITSAKIVDGAVTNSKLATNSVDSPQLVNGSVTNTKLGPLSVTGPKIADGAVTTDKIGGLQVTAPKLGNLAVTTAKLDNRAVTGPKLDDGAVGTAKIEGFAVTNPKLGTYAVNDRVLATDAVTTIKIRNGAVTADKIRDGGVTNNKLAHGIDASKLIGILHMNLIAPGDITPGKTNFMGNVKRLFAGQVTRGVTINDLPTGWTVARNFVSPVGAYTVTHNLGTYEYTVLLSISGAPGDPGVPVSSISNNSFTVFVRRPGSNEDYVDQGFSFILAML